MSVEVVGGDRTVVDLLCSAFISPAALPDCPAAQVGILAAAAAWYHCPASGALRAWGIVHRRRDHRVAAK
jgi:hypothetical protein